jgi:ParB family chromosome partitioning protein
LLQLSPKTQKAVVEKKITAGHAKVLVGLDEKDQQLIVNSIVGQKLSVREVELLIKNRKEPEQIEKKEKISEVFDFSKIRQKFITLDFKYKTSHNKIILEFSSQKQIEDFLKHIKE